MKKSFMSFLAVFAGIVLLFAGCATASEVDDSAEEVAAEEMASESGEESEAEEMAEELDEEEFPWGHDQESLNMEPDAVLDPLGDISSDELSEGNMIQNGAFDQDEPFYEDEEGWIQYAWGGAEGGTAEIIDGELHAKIPNSHGTPWEYQLIQYGIDLVEGETYVFAFDARGAERRFIDLNLSIGMEPWTFFWQDKRHPIDTEMQRYVYEFVVDRSTFENARIEFNLGADDIDVILDNIEIYKK